MKVSTALVATICSLVAVSTGQNQRPNGQNPIELGRSCRTDKGRKGGCGSNAFCRGMPINSPRLGFGICWCRSKAFRQPASLPPENQISLELEMGYSFWTDCVPMLQIGDVCTPPSGNNNYGGYNYNNYGVYGGGGGGGNYGFGNYNYDATNAPPSGNSDILPPGSECNARNGTVQCKQGWVEKDSTECVRATGRVFQGRRGSGLFGEACDRGFCDSARGLRCLEDLDGNTVCQCNRGQWRDGVCSNVKYQGDPCFRDSECNQGRSNPNNVELRLVCRQSGGVSGAGGFGNYGGNSYGGNSYGGNSYGGNSYGGNSYGEGDYTDTTVGSTCQCPAGGRGTETSAALLAPYVETNENVYLPASGVNAAVGSPNTLLKTPVRLSETQDEMTVPVATWCLDSSAFTFKEQGFLGACELTTEVRPGNTFRYCASGLACMYFPVTKEDRQTSGRCVPPSGNDQRWGDPAPSSSNSASSGTNSGSSSNNNNDDNNNNNNGNFNNGGVSVNTQAVTTTTANVVSAGGRLHLDPSFTFVVSLLAAVFRR